VENPQSPGVPELTGVAQKEAGSMKKISVLVVVIGISLFFGASLFAANQAAKAPDMVTLDSISTTYEPVFFTHERHVSLAGDCSVCHHEHQSIKSLPCKDCHSLPSSAFESSLTKNFTACRNCHGSASPDTPAVPGLKVALHQTCFQCHRGMGNIGADPKGCTEICHAKKEQKITKK
jgi:hypothetical protein